MTTQHCPGWHGAECTIFECRCRCHYGKTRLWLRDKYWLARALIHCLHCGSCAVYVEMRATSYAEIGEQIRTAPRKGFPWASVPLLLIIAIGLAVVVWWMFQIAGSSG